MEIYKYKNYEEYKKKQIEANVRKLDRTWVDPASLKNVMKYIHDNLNVKPRKILCHGTRRGLETANEENQFDSHWATPTKPISPRGGVVG